MQQELFLSLLAELHARVKEIQHPSTLYIGGGTPSTYPARDIVRLVQEVATVQGRSLPLEEVTVEVNPSDIISGASQEEEDYCHILHRGGVTRLSMGIQSFDDSLLHFMGRRHNSTQALEAYHTAEKCFDNISIDLIFGFPSLTRSLWNQTLEQTIALRPKHISAYQLSLERDSAWGSLYAKGKLSLPGQEECATQYASLQQRLTQAGYEQYEISNFCLPGFRSRHNSAYWQRVPYTGLGPGAHSFDGINRFWNNPLLDAYIKGIQKDGRPPRKYDRLNDTEASREQVMLSLRTTQGLDTLLYRRLWGVRRYNHLMRAATPLLDRGHLLFEDGYLKINPPQFFVADSFIRDLF